MLLPRPSSPRPPLPDFPELTMPLFATDLAAFVVGILGLAAVSFALVVPLALVVPFALVVLGFLVVVPDLLVVLGLLTALAVPLPLLLAAAARLLLTGALRTAPPLGRDAADVAEAPTVALPTIGRLRNRMCCCPSVHTFVVTQ